MSGGGSRGQYGSGSFAIPQGFGFQSQNQNPTLQNSMSYGMGRASEMPGFQRRAPGQYGAGSSGPWPMNPDGTPIPASPPSFPAFPMGPLGRSPGTMQNNGLPMGDSGQFNTKSAPYYANDQQPGAQFIGNTKPAPYFANEQQPQAQQGHPLMNAGLLQQLFGNRY
jgi:hypothetical protein